MIRAHKVTLSGGQNHENVNIYTAEDMKRLGVPLWFEDATYGLETHEGKLILPSYKIIVICINRHKKKLDNKLSRKITRLSLADELTYGPCWIAHPNKIEELGIPRIFKPYEQFSFCCSEGLFVTTDFNVNGVLI
jgi:hypothetical protein